MFADFFTPTTVGIILIVLALMVIDLSGKLTSIGFEVDRLRLKTYELEEAIEKLERTNEKLKDNLRNLKYFPNNPIVYD